MPDDPRVAIVAVMVTGAVGILGPLITWGATRDSQRAARATARETQRLAGAQLAARSELAQLRSALDQALRDLNSTEARAKGKLRAWQDEENSTAQVRDAQRALTKSFVRARGDKLRLAVRLGVGDPIYEHYNEAIYDFGIVGDYTRRSRPPSRANRQSARLQIQNAHEQSLEAIAAAFARAKIRLR
jgi:hypothetical protein